MANYYNSFPSKKCNPQLYKEIKDHEVQDDMTMGKMVVLKPVVWNDNGYTWPAGIPATSGYSKDHGYGHEEWNGRSDWIWNGWKLFHTEAKGQMLKYATEGRLGIIMTTMHKGHFYAVGVGCNVYHNSKEENVRIAEALGFADYADELWAVESIRRAKNGRRSAFDQHWRNHQHVNWRCPQTHFAWFGKPVPIIPNALIPSTPPRQAIVKMHGSYQGIRPDQALSIVSSTLASDHSVISWLSTNDFDPVRNMKVRSAQPPKNGGYHSASTAVDPVIRYMQEYELVISPRHHKLQQDFEAHLKKLGSNTVQANIERVDVRFNDPEHGLVLAEIKPTEPATVRFAVRAAIGQLFDYRQRAKGDPAMLIVIDDQPCQEDLALALDNGFGIAWRTGKDFAYRWPTN